jgi:hypothetical protein
MNLSTLCITDIRKSTNKLVLFLMHSNPLSWQLPTFALKRLSSVLQGLTSLFEMGKGVTPATNHQDGGFEYFFSDPA